MCDSTKHVERFSWVFDFCCKHYMMRGEAQTFLSPPICHHFLAAQSNTNHRPTPPATAQRILFFPAPRRYLGPSQYCILFLNSMNDHEFDFLSGFILNEYWKKFGLDCWFSWRIQFPEPSGSFVWWWQWCYQRARKNSVWYYISKLCHWCR